MSAASSSSSSYSSSPLSRQQTIQFPAGENEMLTFPSLVKLQKVFATLTRSIFEILINLAEKGSFVGVSNSVINTFH